MRSLLDGTLAALRGAAAVEQPIAALADELYKMRSSLPAHSWRQWSEVQVRAHPLYPVLLEDPFVRHSAERPRGYPGDAGLLDYIYETGNTVSALRQASDLGRRLYDYTHTAPAPAAVRGRLELAIAEIERLAAGGGRPHILSVACGHLREAPRLSSLRDGTLGRFVALDQDPLSLALVRRDWADRGVEVREGSALGLIRNGHQGLGCFDFIYALGLYDYLSDEAGRRLLSAAVDMLNPGGRVWIANFTEDLWSSGYMEAVMDWWLIYRSQSHLASMAEYVDRGKIASQRVFFEPGRNVAILEVVKS
jgi:extracellular factor (EF) 3-hydroxypalmitic acid methyl ester biosynthesis protein